MTEANVRAVIGQRDVLPAREALPWTEHKPSPGGAGWSATCDWGDCEEPAVTVRWEDRLKVWLPVCAGHAPHRDARCAALHPSHRAWSASDPGCHNSPYRLTPGHAESPPPRRGAFLCVPTRPGAGGNGAHS